MLTWLGVPGTPDAWRELGFGMHEGHARAGAVGFELAADEPRWSFDRLAADPESIGIPTRQDPPPDGPPPGNPNGATHIDHVVVLTPDLDSGVAALTATLGMDPRRRFRPRPGGPEMVFFRAGEAVLEVIGRGGPRLSGVAFSSPDLDATVEAVRGAGAPIGDPKPAVQGGRIASVWRGHLGFGIAFLEPPPPGESG